jgi:GT2 family glycosyltransferase
MCRGLSLIVCTCRRPEAIRTLLEALRTQIGPPDETLIIDGSPDDRTERVAAQCSGHALRYFRVPPDQRGLTRQRNYGVPRAGGEIIAFLDDDTVPEPDYFQEIRRCFERHPEAGGVGGYIVEPVWRPATNDAKPPLGLFRWEGWERREDYRWRLRKLLRLDSPLPPGWIPPCGHARSTGCIRPDGQDYRVEFIMGGASAWRRNLLEAEEFSEAFEGYGLYEDLDFSIRASRRAPLYLCTRAKLAHYHEPSARPRPFHYGRMVVRNGWYVWRLRWPDPRHLDRFRWWAVTVLLALCRLVDVRGPNKLQGPLEAAGRFAGMFAVLMTGRASG